MCPKAVMDSNFLSNHDNRGPVAEDLRGPGNQESNHFR